MLELPLQLRSQILATLSDPELAALKYDWEFWSRPEQRIPAGDWITWLIKAGRGFGKTRTGSETTRIWSKTNRYVNLIAPTADDARDIMIEGESGILAVCPWWDRPRYEPSKRRLAWPNGCLSLIFTADEPDRLRGKQHEKLWADELGSWRYAESWDQAQLGLRLGTDPKVIVTTTPRPIELVRNLTRDKTTFVTNGSTYDNRANLAPAFYTKVIKKYEGTRLGRQELMGELLDDNPDALFTRDNIEKARIGVGPADYDRVVIAIDPAATSNAMSDDTGLVACGKKGDQGFVLADRTLKASPLDWARAAIALYRELKADRIVAETNNGGDMVISTIRTIDPNVPVTAVTATRGKALRAEPIAALYEQGRIHHVGMFAQLEDQMCEWNPADKNAKSPDRMDALVWAFTELMLADTELGMIEYITAAKRAVVPEEPKPGINMPGTSTRTIVGFHV